MIRPLGHRILVQADEVETKTKSGLVLALDEKLEAGAKVTGTVIAIGPTAYTHPDLGAEPVLEPETRRVIRYKANPWCKVGDRVYWAKYAGKRVVDPDDPDTEPGTGSKIMIILNDEDLCCIVTKDV